MAGVLQGFQQGYGMVRDMQERDRNQEEREFQRQRQSQADQRSQEQHGALMRSYGLKNDLAEKQNNRFGVLAGQQDQQFEQNSDLNSLKIKNAKIDGKAAEFNLDKAKKDAAMKDAQATWKNLYAQAVDPKTGQLRDPSSYSPELVNQYREFYSKYSDLPAYSHLKDPDSAIELKNSFANGGMPQLKHIKSSYQGLANKSVGLPARGGGTIAQNEIVGIEPTKDGEKIKIKMRTYRDDGSSYYSYVSNGRSSEPGTGILELPWESVFNDIQSKAASAQVAKAIHSQMQSYGMQNQSKREVLGVKDAHAAIAEIDKQIINLQTADLTDPTAREQVARQLETLNYQKQQIQRQAGFNTFDDHQNQQVQQQALTLSGGDQQLALDAINEFKLAQANGENISIQEIIETLKGGSSALNINDDQASQIAENLRSQAPEVNNSDPFLANSRF